MDHAELETAVKKLGTSIGGIRDDLRGKFNTIETRFSQIHDDLKELREVLVNVAQFETWRIQHEKQTESMSRRTEELEKKIHKLELMEIQIHSKATMNDRLIWLIITATAAAGSFIVGKYIHFP